MIVFWVAVGVLIALSLVLLLPPLLRTGTRKTAASQSATNVAVYRDQLRELEQDLAAGVLTQETYEESRREVERRLLDDVAEPDPQAPRVTRAGRNAAVILAAALPIIAVLVYFAVGSPQSLTASVASNDAAHSLESEQMRAMVDRLAERLKQQPDDVQGWIMLARSRMALGQFPEAAQAYAKAASQTTTPDAGLFADYADALAMAQGKTLDGEPEKLIKKALAIDPNHVKALALAGSAAFEQRRYADAVVYWERIAKQAPPGSELAKSVNDSITEARGLAQQSGKPLPAPRAEARTSSPAGKPGAATISGVVELAPSLASRVAPTDTVFVFARAVSGSHMPLAITRAQAKDLPLRFTLDEKSAMSPDMSLATQKRVIVVARLSKSGSANGGPGDLEGSTKPVEVGASGIALRIDSEVR